VKYLCAGEGLSAEGFWATVIGGGAAFTCGDSATFINAAVTNRPQQETTTPPRVKQRTFESPTLLVVCMGSP